MKIIQELLKEKQNKIEKELDRVKKAKKFNIEIYLQSDWGNEGEEDVRIDVIDRKVQDDEEETKNIVKEAMIIAKEKFKLKNKRSDIQGRFQIMVKFNNGLLLFLDPKDFGEI
jgi:hypothetical protein